MNYVNIASWAGADNPVGSILSNKWGFYYSGHLQKVSEKLLSTTILYAFFYDFIHAGARADNSNGVNFEHHRKLLLLWSSAESSEE